MKRSGKKSVFQDLGFSEEESRILEAKTLVWSAIDLFVKSRGLKGRRLERILDISQPMVSDLTRGKIDKMTLDKLVRYAERMGLRIGLKIRQPTRKLPPLAA